MRTSVLLAAFLVAPSAFAQEDLTRVDEDVVPRRWLTVSYSPLTLQLQRYGGNIELAFLEHHAIAATLYYAQVHTNEDTNNVFQGVGGEAGYRYYFGAGGARGFFIAPSFLFGSFEAALGDGTKTPYGTFGGALDIGFQALVADRWLICLGGGAQYTHVTATFPDQDFFALPVANSGVLPRLLFSLGFAL